MTNLFLTPKLPQFGKELSLYLTPTPKIDDKYVYKIHSTFGSGGKIERDFDRIMLRDRIGELEIFEASGSLWWTKTARVKSEPLTSIRFPDEKEAIKLANSYLKETKLYDNLSKPASVSYTETLIEKNEEKEIKIVRSRQHVNYEYFLDGLRVWGSGAKIQVSFGNRNKVTEVLKFWRNIKKESKKLELISPESALKKFMNHEAFGDLSEEDSKVQLENIELGYLTLPPLEVQRCLIPVYLFKGFVSTKLMPRYEFNIFVLAAKLPPELLKLSGAPDVGGQLVL